MDDIFTDTYFELVGRTANEVISFIEPQDLLSSVQPGDIDSKSSLLRCKLTQNLKHNSNPIIVLLRLNNDK